MVRLLMLLRWCIWPQRSQVSFTSCLNVVTEEYCNKHFKLIPRVCVGLWMIKKLVGSTPAHTTSPVTIEKISRPGIRSRLPTGPQRAPDKLPTTSVFLSLYRGDEFSIFQKFISQKCLFTPKMNKPVPIVRTSVGCIATFLSHEMAGNNFLHLEAYGSRSKMGLNHGMPLVSYLVVVDKHQ